MKNKTEQDYFRIIEENEIKIQRICSVYALRTEDRQDLIQEVLLNIWKSLPSYRGNAHIDTWVYRIILNVCLRSNYIKKKDRYVSLESVEFEKLFSKETEDSDNLILLRQCIKKLSDPDKSILLLFLEELAYKDIAGIVGISENYVAVKLKRVKEKLANCMKKIN